MFPKILVLQNLLKFTFLPSQIFYNFLEIFGIFPNYFCHPNFLIHFPKSRNQFLMDFPFLFFSSPVGPPTPFALAHRMTQAAQPTTPAHLASQPARPKRPTTSSPTSDRSRAPPPPPPSLCRRYTQAAMASLPLLHTTCSITPPPLDVISPLICRLNRPVKAVMNTIKGRAFVLRCRPLPPPQRSIPAYKRCPPLPGPLHTVGHHSFALFPCFHELPPTTSLPILPRPPRLILWCAPCSINH
jgi:hypothetical protein